MTLFTITHNVIDMSHDLSIQMKKGLLDLCALSLVAKKERYGYELAEVLARKTDSSIGTIYPILRKMKEAGLVTTRLSEDSGGPPRKYYCITDEGRAILQEATSTWTNLSNTVNSIVKE